MKHSNIMDSIKLAAAFLLMVVLFSNHENRFLRCQEINATVGISTHDAHLIVSETQNFTIYLNGSDQINANISLEASHNGTVQIYPNHFKLNSSESIIIFNLTATSPGRIELTAVSSPLGSIDTSNIFIRAVVAISPNLITISSVIGWIYFSVWSVSFYPQIYENYKRKSVIGLNFDFITLNLVGYSLYNTFNFGMYSVPGIQSEYSRRFPRGLNPVELNDVFFSFHAIFASLITVIQCIIYERADHRVSITCRSLLLIFTVVCLSAAALAVLQFIHWLDFLYICSYIKLSITLSKYIPQAFMNFQRKSTSGWSIGNVLCDLTGGILSLLQMAINAYNYDDWVSIFGSPTKFGIGIFTVIFDVLFIMQHYVFYREIKDKSKERQSWKFHLVNSQAEK